MLRARYFNLRAEGIVFKLSAIREYACLLNDSRLTAISSNSHEVVLSYQSIRQVRTISILDDGSEQAHDYPTIDRYQLRFCESKERTLYLSVIDPPRSGRIIGEALDLLLPNVRVLFEPVVFSKQIVEQHTSLFDVAKLVSAKIKNFHVYDNAVGRLEVSSRTGLLPTIAPFIEGKYYEVESLSYEVISDLSKGLVTYSTNGTVRVSGPIVEIALSRLEACL